MTHYNPTVIEIKSHYYSLSYNSNTDVRKAVLFWIPLKGPEEVETPYDLTSKAAWGCVDSKDSPRRCHRVLLIIREIQFMVRWTKREPRILL